MSLLGVFGSLHCGRPNSIQSGVRTLFEDRELEIRENRFTDPACIVIEVLLAHCHDPKRNDVRVKEVAAGTNAILRGPRRKTSKSTHAQSVQFLTSSVCAGSRAIASAAEFCSTPE